MKIGIIGAGISGLTSAYYLQKLGADVTVLEAKDATGGAIKTVLHDGFLAEHGPHTIVEKNEETKELIRDLGLESERVYANDASHIRFAVRGGKVHALPMSPGDFFRTPLFSPLAKLGLLKEPFLFPRDSSDDESVDSFVRRRLGNEFMDYGVDLMINGIWAGDPKKLSIRHAFNKLYTMERDHRSITMGAFANRGTPRAGTKMFSFKKGNQVLTDALTRELADVVTSAPVKSLTYKAGKWTMFYSDHGTSKMKQVDAVIVTSPLWAQELLEIKHPSGDFQPTMPEPVTHPAVSVVTLAYQRKNVEHPLDGFGMLVPEIEKRKILGTLFSSTLFPHRAPNGHVVLSTFVGGARHPELTSVPAPERVSFVRDELESLLGATGRPTYAYEHLCPRAIPQYNVGYGRNLVAFNHMEKSCPGLYFAGSFRNGVSVGELIASGSETANRVLQSKGQP